MGGEHRKLYGIRYGRLRALGTEAAVRALLGSVTTPIEVVIPN